MKAFWTGTGMSRSGTQTRRLLSVRSAKRSALAFQAVEHLDLARDRVGIIHRGLDEVVDIKGFHIERLAHVGAAITQYASHLGLVALGIELRLNGVGAGRHQTERKERS